MSLTSAVTIVGTVSRDPELRYTPSGATVCTVGVVYNTRTKNKTTNEWEDGPGQFYDVKCWGTLAENVAESISKGDRVVVAGELEFRSWQTDGGENRSKVEIKAEAIGPDLRWATAHVQKIQRSDSTQRGGGQPQQSQPSGNPFG